jgi:AraC-like DNA-binding protein
MQNTAHGVGTTLTGWETVELPPFSSSKLSHSSAASRSVAALVLDRLDLARLHEALRPSPAAPIVGVLRAFTRLAVLEAALQRSHFDVLVIEPVDADGCRTENAIRSIRARFPRLSVLGHVSMKPGMSAQVLSFARTGVHELIVAGIDDSAIVLRHTLQRAARRCLAEEVFAEVKGSLPHDASCLMRYCLEHACEAPDINQISQALGMHRRTLVNRMQSANLPPPSELWAWSRVLLAARYLEMPGRSVEWVAHTVGYPSANALRNSLKKYARLVPSELREDDGFARATLAFRAALLSTTRASRPLPVSAATPPLERTHRAAPTHKVMATAGPPI